MTLDEQAILRLNDLLREAGRRIVIVSHTNPDGDAVGSSLAWAEILRGMGPVSYTHLGAQRRQLAGRLV